jgi:hypothetical protein
VSAGSSPHLPLVIILRKIQRENSLREKRESVKGEKIWEWGDGAEEVQTKGRYRQ